MKSLKILLIITSIITGLTLFGCRDNTPPKIEQRLSSTGSPIIKITDKSSISSADIIFEDKKGVPYSVSVKPDHGIVKVEEAFGLRVESGTNDPEKPTEITATYEPTKKGFPPIINFDPTKAWVEATDHYGNNQKVSLKQYQN